MPPHHMPAFCSCSFSAIWCCLQTSHTNKSDQGGGWSLVRFLLFRSLGEVDFHLHNLVSRYEKQAYFSRGLGWWKKMVGMLREETPCSSIDNLQLWIASSSAAISNHHTFMLSTFFFTRCNNFIGKPSTKTNYFWWSSWATNWEKSTSSCSGWSQSLRRQTHQSHRSDPILVLRTTHILCSHFYLARSFQKITKFRGSVW